MKHWNIRLVVATLCCMSIHVACAMTYAELKQQISSADDGATIYLQNDLEYDSQLNVDGKRITIASPEGSRFVLKRKSSFRYQLFFMGNKDLPADVTLRNVIVDGNKEVSTAGRLFTVTNGVLRLESGTTIRNYNFGTTANAMLVASEGKLVINDGAEIKDCDQASWGMICVGATKPYQGGLIEMNGGLITGCHCSYGSRNAGYDGLVYVYQGGRFEMRGGLITGNRSDNCVAGVSIYSDNATMFLSGNASITNNVGGIVNDIYARYSPIEVSNYTGRATIWYGTDAGVQTQPAIDDQCTRVRRTTPDVPVLGLGGISIQNYPQLVMDGYSWPNSTTVYIGKLTSAIEGGAVAATLAESMASASQDDKIVLLRDFVDELISCNEAKSYTIRGDVPTRKLTRTRNNTIAVKVENGASMKFENILIDGNKDNISGVSGPMFYVNTDSCVTLGAGAVVCNCRSQGDGNGSTNHLGPSVVTINTEGARFVMEDGSVIRDCEVTSTGSWGAVIRIGSGNNNYTNPPKFEMKGGLITGNVCASTGAAGSGYGGIIYIQRGVFEMTGGTITGNTSERSCAGVMAYIGKMRVSGAARVENNSGAAPDVYCVSSASITMFGDFRGHVGVSSPTQELGKTTTINIEDNATGAWGFYPAANSAEAGIVGTANGDKVAWARATGTIDGDGIASVNDATLAWSGITLSLTDANRELLPHVFSGTALGANGRVTLDFDGDMYKNAAFLPLQILSAEDGVFTGTWDFVLPTVRGGEWTVFARRDENGVTGYWLTFHKVGSVLFIR